MVGIWGERGNFGFWVTGRPCYPDFYETDRQWISHVFLRAAPCAFSIAPPPGLTLSPQKAPSIPWWFSRASIFYTLPVSCTLWNWERTCGSNCYKLYRGNAFLLSTAVGLIGVKAGRKKTSEMAGSISIPSRLSAVQQRLDYLEFLRKVSLPGLVLDLLKPTVISILRNINIWKTAHQTLIEVPHDQGVFCFLTAFETDVSWDNSGHILGVWGGEGVANLLRIYRQQKKNNS